MQSAYERKLAAAQARRVANEHDRKAHFEKGRRESVLTPDELRRYEELVAVPTNPPPREVNRDLAAYYVALILVGLVWLVVILVMVAHSHRDVVPPLIASAIALGLLIVLGRPMSARARRFSAAHAAARENAIGDYLVEVRYPERLAEYLASLPDDDDYYPFSTRRSR